jgi:serine/threonine protein kinase
MYNGAVGPAQPLMAGRYRLGALLGRGAMAEVYRAEDVRARRTVAVKLFHPDPDPVERRRFADEARALARFSHPGLVPVYDAGVSEGSPYIAMLLVEGETLRSRLQSGPVARAQVIGWGARLATAIGHVHRGGVIHRDIKPSNILLDVDGSPHLCDFGIALLAGFGRVTSSGEVMGTPAYLAPEQVLGRAIGPAADVYALGLVLLECLTGRMAFPSTNKVETALVRLQESPTVPVELPDELAALLSSMTAMTPNLRPTADQCAATLLRLERLPSPERELWEAQTEEPAPVPAAGGFHWRPLALAIGAAMGIVVAAVTMR